MQHTHIRHVIYKLQLVLANSCAHYWLVYYAGYLAC